MQEQDKGEPMRSEPAALRRLWTIWLVSSFALTLVIGILTLLPSPQLPRSDLLWDKLAHLIAFMALMLPTSALWPRMIVPAAGLAIFYGAAIEVIQPFTGRSAELADLIADGIGVGLGIVVGLGLRRAVLLLRAARAD